MDELKSHGRSLGLNETQIGVALRLDRSATETIWVSTADSVRVAEQVFEKGRLLEYECLDNDGKNQGNATLELLEWASEGDGFFRGQHMGASDEYYEWCASQALVPPENCLYHLCSSDPAACKKKPRRGDRREVVHIGRWRLLTPLVMVEEPYLEREGVRFGKQAMDDMARDVRAHKAGPLGVSPVGTGLDAVMAEPPKPPDDRGGGKEPKRKKSRSRSPRKGPKGLAGYLRERAEAHQQKQADESRRGRRREKEKKSRAEKEARRKAKDLGDSSSSDDESSAGSSVFRTAPSRGQRAEANRPKEAREAAGRKPPRDGEVSGRKRRRRRRRRGLERPKGDGLRGSSDAGHPSSGQDRHKESLRGDKHSHGFGSVAAGEARRMRGPLGSKAEGLGDKFRGRQLELRETPGADTRDGGHDDKSKGKGTDRQGRTKVPEVEAGPAESQIGKRQRRDEAHESCRESEREEGIGEPRTGRPREEQPEGDLRKGGESDTSERKLPHCLESSSSSRGKRFRRRTSEVEGGRREKTPDPGRGEGRSEGHGQRKKKGLVAKERTKRGQERKRQREEQESDAAPLEHPDSEPEPCSLRSLASCQQPRLASTCFCRSFAVKGIWPIMQDAAFWRSPTWR